VLDLVEAGGPVADVARDLGISAESIHTWRRQDRIARGLQAGLTSAEKSELTAAKRRIAGLEAELAIHRRASELLGKVVFADQGGLRPFSSGPPWEVIGSDRAGGSPFGALGPSPIMRSSCRPENGPKRLHPSAGVHPRRRCPQLGGDDPVRAVTDGRVLPTV